MSCGSSCYFGINILRFDDSFFVILMYLGFICYNKMCSHLDAFCSQHECRSNSSSIGNSSGCNNRNTDCIYNLWNKYHRCTLADMSAGFTTFCYQCIRTTAFHSFCQGHRSNDRNNLYAGFLPHLHVFLRITRTGGNNLYAFFGNHLCNFICIRTHQHDVDTEWFVCQFFCLAYLISYPVCRSTCCTDESQSAGFGYTCCQMVFCHPGHTALKDRVFNS